MSAITDPLQTEFVFEARVAVDAPQVLGPSSRGLRRIIPIKGGEVSGPALKGRVLPGGADWQFVRPDGVLELLAKYTIQADDGALILVENRGIRSGSPEIMARLAKGEAVDPKDYYSRTTPSFEAPLGSKHEWLNRMIFVANAERLPEGVVVRFYKVK